MHPVPVAAAAVRHGLRGAETTTAGTKAARARPHLERRPRRRALSNLRRRGGRACRAATGCWRGRPTRSSCWRSSKGPKMVRMAQPVPHTQRRRVERMRPALMGVFRSVQSSHRASMRWTDATYIAPLTMLDARPRVRARLSLRARPSSDATSSTKEATRSAIAPAPCCRPRTTRRWSPPPPTCAHAGASAAAAVAAAAAPLGRWIG